MSAQPLILAIPSKGRLKEKTEQIFENANLPIVKTGDERGYRGMIEGLENVEVAFLSASEIALNLKNGTVHLGITGEDLLRENITQFDQKVELVKPLGFGGADVIVAVPDAWLDVRTMADLDDMSEQFQNAHGRVLRVATKYFNITRNFFREKGVAGYRIVESVGATEGAPAASTAEVIVDITSTGSTLQANHLRILDDGLILKSEANLVLSKTAPLSPEQNEAKEAIIKAMSS